MTTNTIRWLQAILVVVLFALSVWQSSVAGSLHDGKLAFPHLVISLLLIVPAAILIFHDVVGDLVFRRATLVAFFAGFLWYNLQSLNRFVLGLNGVKEDVLRAAGYGIMFGIYLHFELKRNHKAMSAIDETDTPIFPRNGYSATDDLPLGSRPPRDTGIPFMSQAPSDPLPTERGVYYPD